MSTNKIGHLKIPRELISEIVKWSQFELDDSGLALLSDCFENNKIIDR